MFFAISVIIIGVTFLLSNLGIISGFGWGLVWPSLLILWGISAILRPRSAYCCCGPYITEERAKTESE